MNKLRWLWFALMCRFKRVALPRHVDRYAVMIRAKKPFFQWARRMLNVPPPPGAQFGKVFLLPLASEMDQADFFSQALPYILLDLFSDFDVAEDDLPDLSDQNKLNQWFEFERLEGVMDYSTGNIRTELYRF